MSALSFDIAHLLAGGMLVLSFLLLYQDRITATLNVFALQAIVLSLAVAWQAYIQDAPHLILTATLALVVKGFIIPTALHRIVRRLGIHRDIEQVIGGGGGAQHHDHRQRDKAHAEQHGDADAADRLDVAVNAEPDDDTMQDHRNDDGLEHERYA